MSQKVYTSNNPAIVWLILCALLGLPPVAGGVVVDNLYAVTVPVADTSEELREEAIGNALGAVLVRVTGSRGASADSRLQRVTDNAAAYVQVYRYGRGDGGELRLSVTFDGNAVEQAVAAAGLPVWGAERPKLLIWLAVDYGGGQRTIISSDNEGSVANTLRAAATQRGLPVSFPLMDAEDREQVSFADVWGGFNQTIMAASQRYQPDAILTGRARRRQGGRLGVEWRLYFASGVYASDGGLTEGIESAADYFARQFVVGGGDESGRVMVEVGGIDSVATFAAVISHLETLSAVETVKVLEVRDDTFRIELGLRGSAEQLRRAISLRGLLEEAEKAELPLQPGLLHFKVAR